MSNAYRSFKAGVVLASAFLGPWICRAEIKVTEAQAKQAAISKSMPEYPAMARQLKITGRVELELVIASDGKVEEVKIVSGNPVLTRPCAKVVQEWRFSPFEEAGKPTRATAPLTFEFR